MRCTVPFLSLLICSVLFYSMLCYVVLSYLWSGLTIETGDSVLVDHTDVPLFQLKNELLRGALSIFKGSKHGEKRREEKRRGEEGGRLWRDKREHIRSDENTDKILEWKKPNMVIIKMNQINNKCTAKNRYGKRKRELHSNPSQAKYKEVINNDSRAVSVQILVFAHHSDFI